MTRTGYDKIWVIFDPPGRWTTGPIVCTMEDIVQQYRDSEIDYEIVGPYILVQDA